MKTNRIIMLLFGLLIVFLIYKQIPKAVNLNGDYYLSSMHLKSQTEWRNSVPDSLYACVDSIPALRILSKDSLEFYPAIGNLLFGHTRFKYEVSRKSIRISYKNDVEDLPYRENETSLTLGINQRNIKTITLKKQPSHGISFVGKTN